MKRALAVAFVVLIAAACSSGGGSVRDAAIDTASSVDGSLGALIDSPTGTGDGPQGSLADAARPLDGPFDSAADGLVGGTDAPVADAGSLDALPDAQVDVGAEAGFAPDAPPADANPPMLVTMQFTGKVFTVAGMPLGFDASAKDKPVTGTFGYDLRTSDSSPIDPKRGTYKHGAGSVFTLTILGRNIEGSGRAIIDVENFDPDTFRFNDGPEFDAVPRPMKVDGVVAPNLKLTIAITDETGAMLMSDALPNPFPALEFPKTSHTFALKDSNDVLLIQLDSLTKL